MLIASTDRTHIKKVLYPYRIN